MNEEKVVSMNRQSTVNYQDMLELKTDIKEMQSKITYLEKELTSTEDNKVILRELKVVISELTEWRKSSDVKLQNQNDNQIKMTMVLDQLTKSTEANTKQITDMKSKGSVTFNDMFKKAFWIIFASFIGLIIGILGWAPK